MANCSRCGTSMKFIDEYNRWYCVSCKDYSFPIPSQHRQPYTQSKRKEKIGYAVAIIVILIIIGVFATMFVLREKPDKLEIHIITDGYWHGEIKDGYDVRSVNGTGNEIIEVKSNNVRAIIMPGFFLEKLVVQIRGDGKILDEASTSESSGIVIVSYSY